jgi:tetratricopeptide (TPR) repeat protein
MSRTLGVIVAFGGFGFFAVLLLGGCAVGPTGERIDNVPMYGQPEIPRPEFMRRADEEFIASAIAGAGSREKASEMWVTQGDNYLNSGNADFAMRRYNQSWLLNPTNYKSFWGFGRAILEKGKFDESIKHFDHAMALIQDQSQRPALLADFGAAYSLKANSLPLSESGPRAHFFLLANKTFEEAVQLDSTYANTWPSWAMSLYREGHYAEAWKKVKEARRQNAAPPPMFLRALENRLPEPQ